MGQYVNIVSAFRWVCILFIRSSSCTKKLVHAQVSHTQGKTCCTHQDILPCLHDPGNAQPHCRSLLGWTAVSLSLQEEALYRRYQAPLAAGPQDS